MMQGNTNPYATPVSELRNSSAEEYGAVKMFSVSGRLGRVRYIAYSAALILVAWLGGSILMGIVAAIISSISKEAGMISIWAMLAVVYGAMIIVSFMLAIQRAHDFNTSGWITLLFLVPLVNVIFCFALWFIPGTNDENRYGKKNPPNGTGVFIMAALVPFIFIFIIGVLAAVAIPQYQKYKMKAQEAAQSR